MLANFFSQLQEGFTVRAVLHNGFFLVLACFFFLLFRRMLALFISPNNCSANEQSNDNANKNLFHGLVAFACDFL